MSSRRAGNPHRHKGRSRSPHDAAARLLSALGTYWWVSVVIEGAPLPPIETLADARDFALAVPKYGIEVVAERDVAAVRVERVERAWERLREAELVGSR